MNLRQILLPPLLDSIQIDAIADLAGQIVNAIDNSANPAALIERLNEMTARPYDIADIAGVAGAMEMEEFAALALTPDPPWVADITREEMLELIWRAGYAEYGTYPDHEFHYYGQLLRRNLGVPSLAFDPSLTPEEVLEKALARKPIAL